jgi:hypothetical protein
MIERLLNCCFEVMINLNDTFHYSSADTDAINCEDLIEILPIFERFGNDALVAYVALKRGQDPTIPKRCTPEFQIAKAEIAELKAQGKITLEDSLATMDWYYEAKKQKERADKLEEGNQSKQNHGLI